MKQPSNSLFSRTHLESYFDNYSSYSSIFLFGAAGTGKTAAIQHWLLTRSQPFLYLTPNHHLIDTPEKFIDYLKNKTNAEKTTLKNKKQEKKYIIQAENILQNYVDWNCAEHLRLICIWDMSSETWPDPLKKFLIHNIQNPSKNVFHIFLSRHPLAPLNRLTLRQPIKLICFDELKFSEQEFDALLIEQHEIQKNKNQWDFLAKEFYKKSCGWPIMLYFFIHYLNKKITLGKLLHNAEPINHLLFNTIQTQIIEKLDETTQKILSHSAILPLITLQLCTKITTLEESLCKKQLKYLEELQLLTKKNDQHWQPAQPLLTDFFINYWSEKNPHLLTQVYTTAEKWYEDNDIFDQAIEIALHLKNWEHAIYLLERHAFILARNQNWKKITNWINQLPKEMILEKSVIASLNAWRYATSEKNNRSPMIFSRINFSNVNLKNNPQISRLAYHVSDMQCEQDFSRLSHISDAVAALNQPLTSIHLKKQITQKNMLEKSLTPTQIFLSAIEQLNAENLSAAHETLKKLISASLSEINTSFVFNGLFLISFTAHHLGQSHELIPISEKINQWAKEQHHQDHPLAPWLQGFLCLNSIESNALSLAKTQLIELSTLLNQDIDPVHKFFVYYLQATLAMSHFDYTQAWQALDSAENYLTQSSYSFIEPLASISHLRTKILLLKGENKTALAFLEKNIEQYKISTYNKLLHAHYCFQEEKEKNRKLQEILKKTEQNKHLHTYHYALSAYLCYQNSDYKTANTHLEKAIKSSEQYNYKRTLLDFGKPMAHLIIEAYEKSPNSIIKTQLYEALKKESYFDTLDNSLMHLSKKEKEILQMVACGYSNEKIAQTLYRSPGTIKLHVHNIYKKLGISNRVQAIKKYQAEN